MTYQLRMSTEIGDWLAEVCAAEPVAATELGAALLVLAEAAELPGQPLVTDLAADRDPAEPDAGDPREAADVVYQELLEALQNVRRQVAEAAWYRTARRSRIGVNAHGESFTEDLPFSEAELAAAAELERELTERSQRLQRDVDAFRTAKETAKAMYTAAEGSLRVHDAIAMAESSGDLAGGPDLATPDDDEEVARLSQALTAAHDSMRAVLARARQTLREIRRAGQPGGRDQPGGRAGGESEQAGYDDAATAVPGLLELRADPLGADLRILFAAQPAGALTLLAVLDGAEAIADHRDEAISLASQLLTEIREGGRLPAEAEPAEDDEVCFTDGATLLTKILPGRGTAIRARAAELAVAGTLTALRRDRELSLAEVAAGSGLREHRVWELEHTGLRSAELREAAAYVRALGGRLEIAASLQDGQQVRLS